MFITTSSCSFKCEQESGIGCCQNSSLAKAEIIDIADEKLIERYLGNPITKAIVFGGLEPFDQYDELYSFIRLLRGEYRCNDTVVIYTGYNREEIDGYIWMLRSFDNIIVKFGRYVPGQRAHYDEILGVKLASDNQYAEII